jgi:hypothetical protein
MWWQLYEEHNWIKKNNIVGNSQAMEVKLSGNVKRATMLDRIKMNIGSHTDFKDGLLQRKNVS